MHTHTYAAPKHVQVHRFNPWSLQVMFRKNIVWNVVETYPRSANNIEPDETIVWLSIRQLPIFLWHVLTVSSSSSSYNYKAGRNLIDH